MAFAGGILGTAYNMLSALKSVPVQSGVGFGVGTGTGTASPGLPGVKPVAPVAPTASSVLKPIAPTPGQVAASTNPPSGTFKPAPAPTPPKPPVPPGPTGGPNIQAADTPNLPTNKPTPDIGNGAGTGSGTGEGTNTSSSYTSPYKAQVDALTQKLAASQTPTDEEKTLQQQIDELIGSTKTGVAGLEGRVAGEPLALVRGEQAKLQQQGDLKAQTLQQKLADMIANRTASQEALKTQLASAQSGLTADTSKTNPTTVGNSILQYDPTTGTYKTLFTAPEKANEQPATVQEYEYAKKTGYAGSFLDYQSAKNDATTKGPATPANQQDYNFAVSQGFKGSFLDYLAAAAGKPTADATAAQTAQTKQNAVSVIDNLLNSPGLTGAVGAKGLSSLFGILSNPLGGTNAADFKAQFNSLKSMLSLENIAQLKGTGAISDSEERMLSQASSALSTDMSEEAFKQELARVRDVLTGGKELPAGANNEQVQSAIQQMKASGDFSDEDIQQWKATRGLTNDLSMSGNGSINLGSHLAMVNNNPGNLRFAGQAGASQGQGGFASFSTPQAGYNALLGQIGLDASRGHTLASFISKYAPSSENDTAQYIQQVTKMTGYPPNTPLNQIDKDVLGKAIIRKESSSSFA